MKRAPVLVSMILVAACASTQPPVVVSPSEYAHIPLFKSGEGMVPPKVIHRTDPASSDELRNRTFAAVAQIEFVIDEQGKVVAAWFVEGDPEWGRIVSAAVRQWQFTPATRDGEPIAVRSRMTSKFRKHY